MLRPRHRAVGLVAVAGAAVALSTMASAGDSAAPDRTITLLSPAGAVVGQVTVAIRFPTPSQALASFGASGAVAADANWLRLPGPGRWQVGVAVWYACGSRAGEAGSTVWTVPVRAVGTGQRVAFPTIRLSVACTGRMVRSVVRVGACAGRHGRVIGAGGARARVCLASVTS